MINYRLACKNVPSTTVWFTHSEPSKYVDMSMILPGTVFLETATPIRAGTVTICLDPEQLGSMLLWAESQLCQDGLYDEPLTVVGEATHTDPAEVVRKYFAIMSFSMSIFCGPCITIGLQKTIGGKGIAKFVFPMAKSPWYRRLALIILGMSRHGVIAESMEPFAEFLSKCLHRPRLEIMHE